MNKQNISKYLLDKADFQKSKKPIGSGTFGEVFVFTKNEIKSIASGEANFSKPF